MTLRDIAFHEAGHACIAILEGIPVSRVTIEPCGDSAGRMIPSVRLSEVETSAWLKTLAAAAAAERKLTGKQAQGERGEGGDEYYMRLILSSHFNYDEEQIAERLTRQATLADVQVELNWPWISRVAERLLRKRTITGAQVAGLMDGGT